MPHKDHEAHSRPAREGVDDVPPIVAPREPDPTHGVEFTGESGGKVATLCKRIRSGLLAWTEYTSKEAQVEASEEIRSSAERGTLLLALEKQYPNMRKALEAYKISTKGMPPWRHIKKGLTQDVLRSAMKLTEPSLLLIPPTTRKEKYTAINTYPTANPEEWRINLNDDKAWSPESERSGGEWCYWRAVIVEGAQNVDVEHDPFLRTLVNDVREPIRLGVADWVDVLKSQGVNVMEGADAYMTLMMKSLVEGRPIDTRTYTVLNAKHLDQRTERSHLSPDWTYYPRVSFGALRGRDRVWLDQNETATVIEMVSRRWRLRGLVELNVRGCAHMWLADASVPPKHDDLF